MGCIACHKGKNVAEREQAHEGLVASPSAGEDGGGVCTQCHSEVVETFKTSLHYTLAGFQNSLQTFSHEGVLDEEGGLATAWDKNCYGCHATCGQCHVSRPEAIKGGLVQNHTFRKTPEMDTQCYGCHGARPAGEYLGTVGFAADTHYENKEMSCMSCHPQSNFHGLGEGEAERRRDEDKLPKCENCHKDVYKDSEVTAHSVHDSELMSCYVCHSYPNNNCFGCHITVHEDGSLTSHSETKVMFRIGLNPNPTEERPWKYVALRHIPTTADTFIELGEGLLPNFDQISNWKESTTHNIQRSTPQNSDCNSCHGNKSLFLQESDLVPEDSEASRKLVVTEIPPAM